MADTALVPDDGGTAGSRTTPSTVPAIRKACAAARQLLLDTAAVTFNSDAKTLSVRDGEVAGLGSGGQFSYVDLAGEKHAPMTEDFLIETLSPFEMTYRGYLALLQHQPDERRNTPSQVGGTSRT